MFDCGGRASLTCHGGHGWTCSLPRPVAIDTLQPVGTLKKGLPQPRLRAIFMLSRLPASDLYCRAVLIQILALQRVSSIRRFRPDARQNRSAFAGTAPSRSTPLPALRLQLPDTASARATAARMLTMIPFSVASFWHVGAAIPRQLLPQPGLLSVQRLLRAGCRYGV